MDFLGAFYESVDSTSGHIANAAKVARRSRSLDDCMSEGIYSPEVCFSPADKYIGRVDGESDYQRSKGMSCSMHASTGPYFRHSRSDCIGEENTPLFRQFDDSPRSDGAEEAKGAGVSKGGGPGGYRRGFRFGTNPFARKNSTWAGDGRSKQAKSGTNKEYLSPGGFAGKGISNKSGSLAERRAALPKNSARDFDSPHALDLGDVLTEDQHLTLSQGSPTQGRTVTSPHCLQNSSWCNVSPRSPSVHSLSPSSGQLNTVDTDNATSTTLPESHCLERSKCTTSIERHPPVSTSHSPRTCLSVAAPGRAMVLATGFESSDSSILRGTSTNPNGQNLDLGLTKSIEVVEDIAWSPVANINGVKSTSPLGPSTATLESSAEGKLPVEGEVVGKATGGARQRSWRRSIFGRSRVSSVAATV